MEEIESVIDSWGRLSQYAASLHDNDSIEEEAYVSMSHDLDNIYQYLKKKMEEEVFGDG